MAASDYRLCDLCGHKAFYDAGLNYELEKNIHIEESFRWAGGELATYTRLDNLGDWAVLCRTCAQSHKCVIVPIEHARGDRDGE